MQDFVFPAELVPPPDVEILKVGRNKYNEIKEKFPGHFKLDIIKQTIQKLTRGNAHDRERGNYRTGQQR